MHNFAGLRRKLRESTTRTLLCFQGISDASSNAHAKCYRFSLQECSIRFPWTSGVHCSYRGVRSKVPDSPALAYSRLPTANHFITPLLFCRISEFFYQTWLGGNHSWGFPETFKRWFATPCLVVMTLGSLGGLPPKNQAGLSYPSQGYLGVAKTGG